jgi:hypothetical protein
MQNAGMTNTSEDTLTEEEWAELQGFNNTFMPAHFDALERELYLRAMVMGWTGDPFKQPVRVVLNIARSVFQNPDPYGLPASAPCLMQYDGNDICRNPPSVTTKALQHSRDLLP